MPSEWSYVEQGDAEGACIDILNNAAEIQAITGVTVSSNMIDFERGDRWIEVIQEGGARPWPYKGDKPRIDFMCYAESRPQALKIAQVAMAVILRAMGDYAGFGIKLHDAKVETGIYRVPDKLTDSYRYTFSLRLTCTPNP